MKNHLLHRYAVFTAACTALLFINGAAVSSNEERPLYTLGKSHIWSGIAVSLLFAGLAIWLELTKERVWLRRLAWALPGLAVLQDLPVFHSGTLPTPVRIFHALVGHICFSATVAIAVFTSVGSGARNDTPPVVENRSLLRFVATITPVLVLVQVTLGTAFRHGAMGGLPHIFWALVMAAFVALTAAAVLNTGNPDMRPAGIALSVAGGLQMLLGFALLTLESFDVDPMVTIVSTAAHAAVGALTMAAALAMAIVVRRALPVAAAS